MLRIYSAGDARHIGPVKSMCAAIRKVSPTVT